MLDAFIKVFLLLKLYYNRALFCCFFLCRFNSSSELILGQLMNDVNSLNLYICLIIDGNVYIHKHPVKCKGNP